METRSSVTSWNAGAQFSLSALKPFLIADKMKEAEAAISEIQTPFLISIVVFFIAFFYLLALDLLPILLSDEKKD